MGWTFSRQWDTKEKMVEYLQKGYENATEFRLTYEKDQWVLWTVLNYKGDLLIVCDLIEPSANGWGHKTMDEGMGPYYYSCPARFLELTDSSPYVNHQWRMDVLKYHAAIHQWKMDVSKYLTK